MRYFDRGEIVQVRSEHGAVWAKAKILCDSGSATVIIDRHGHPRQTQAIRRERVTELEEGERHHATDRKLACVETDRGWCALQRQASLPGSKEMIEGQWTICSAWVTSRSKPEMRLPTCPRCFARL
jgi:hypothetical protein